MLAISVRLRGKAPRVAFYQDNVNRLLEYEPHAAELRKQIPTVASREGIASCLKNDDPATRVLGYIALQSWEDTSDFELAPCFALERRDARRSQGTPPVRG